MLNSREHGFRNAVAQAALGVALAACAELRWHKAGVDAEEVRQDLEQCRQSARLRAGREAWPFGLVSPQVIGTDRQGRLILVHPHPRDTDRFLLEHDLTRICMRGKGYMLAPVDKIGDR